MFWTERLNTMTASLATAPNTRLFGDFNQLPRIRSVVAVLTAEAEAFLATAFFSAPITNSIRLADRETEASGVKHNDSAGVRRSAESGGNVSPSGSDTSRPAPLAMDTTLTPEEQLEELVRDHLDAVYRVAYSVVRDNSLAEDVAQDAILKAWKALPTFRGDSSLRSWLLRITHNTAISTLRKRREEVRDPDLLPERETSMTTEHQVVDRLSMDAFEKALHQLDDLSRSIVVLREVEGLSYEEIATILEVGLPTVKTRLLRSRRVLAAALGEWRA